MTRNQLILVAAGGSAALLLGALAFQYLGDLAPCKLCIWQRWPHLGAILIGAAALVIGLRLLPLIGAGMAATTAGIGIYHTGIEQAWWSGPDTCTSGDIGGMTADQLFDQILSAPVVQCDQIAWAMWGLSMASWNALISLGLAGLWLLALRKTSQV